MTERKFSPYINAYNSISLLFQKIKEAAVPTKFTNDFLHSVLGLKSSSHRAMIPLLKRLDFLGSDGSPTTTYKDYRGEHGKSHILADKLKKSYSDLYQSNEYVHNLDKKEIENIVVRVTGASKTDQQVPAVVNTFLELVKLADFNLPNTQTPPVLIKSENEKDETPIDKNIPSAFRNQSQEGFGLSYTINLNLPPTTEIEVFNAIFKSLKENLLGK